MAGDKRLGLRAERHASTDEGGSAYLAEAVDLDLLGGVGALEAGALAHARLVHEHRGGGARGRRDEAQRAGARGRGRRHVGVRRRAGRERRVGVVEVALALSVVACAGVDVEDVVVEQAVGERELLRHGTLALAGDRIEEEGRGAHVAAAAHAVVLQHAGRIEAVHGAVGVVDSARAVAELVLHKVGAVCGLAEALDALARTVGGVPVQRGAVSAAVGVALALAVVRDTEDQLVA